MAFKEISDLSADTTISLGGFNKKTKKDNPTEVEGYYLGKRQVADNKKKSGFSYIYFFQTPKGNLGVWGKTDLDRKMTSATAGQMMRISVAGTVPTPNGEMYKFKVAFDADNTIEVTAQDQLLNQGGDESSAADDGPTGYNDEDEQQDEDDSYVSAPANSLSAQEKKNRVQELLKGKGKRA